MDRQTNNSQSPYSGEQPSIGQLVKDLVDDSRHLLRTELKLAQAEMKQNVSRMRTPVIAIAAGLLFCMAALFTLMGALVGWLSELVGPGWAAFIVAIFAAAIGVGLILFGRRQLAEGEIAPTRTVSSLKQDAQALKGNA